MASCNKDGILLCSLAKWGYFEWNVSHRRSRENTITELYIIISYMLDVGSVIGLLHNVEVAIDISKIQDAYIFDTEDGVSIYPPKC
jgi:hypothetical protein